jgi:hypothetical protein
MPDGQRVVLRSPAAAEGVDIAAAHAATLDLDVDVIVAEGFGSAL